MKKTYETPELETFGTVEALTKGGDWSATGDWAQFFPNSEIAPHVPSGDSGS